MANEKLNEVLDQRGSRYGDFNDHALTAQEIKKSLNKALQNNLSYAMLSEVEQAVLNEGLSMIAHKLGRIANGDCRYDDSWVDIAGYATITCERLQEK